MFHLWQQLLHLFFLASWEATDLYPAPDNINILFLLGERPFLFFLWLIWERAKRNNIIRRPTRTMPMKIGSVKWKEEGIKYNRLPVSTLPNTSPSGSSSFSSFSWPTIKSKHACLAATRASYSIYKKNSGKHKENTRDGAIVHLTEDGVQQRKSPRWSHDSTCAHSRILEELDTFLKFWIKRGFIFVESRS